MDKTWFLVSNSSLSKTFAVGNLESLKFRSSVLSLQGSFSLKFILSQINFGSEKIFWSEKVLVPRKVFGKKKILCLKNISCPKHVGSKKISRMEKMLGPEKNWVQQLFASLPHHMKPRALVHRSVICHSAVTEIYTKNT